MSLEEQAMFLANALAAQLETLRTENEKLQTHVLRLESALKIAASDNAKLLMQIGELRK